MTARGLLALTVMLGLLVIPVAGHAQGEDLGITVRDSSFEADGSVELVVNVTGTAKPDVLESDAFAVSENGEDVGPVEAEPLLDLQEADVATTLLIDVSNSMSGEPMELTKAAASDLIRNLTGQGVSVGLMTFGDDVQVLSGYTDDTDDLLAVVDDIDVDGWTSLYDGIVAATEQLAGAEGQRNLVVFSDGGDTVSAANLEDAVLAASDVDVPIVSIALETDDLDHEALVELADGTDGRVRLAAEADLSDVFDEVASDIASQYVVRYQSALTESEELDVDVAVSTGDTGAEVTFSVPNPRQGSAVTLESTTRSPGEAGALASTSTMYIGVGAAFAAMLLLFGLLFTGQRTTGDRVLAGQLERYVRHGDQRAGRSGLVATHFRERAMDFMESAPRPKGFDENLRVRLEQAAWPLRNSEFLLLSMGAALLTGLVTGLAFNALGGLLVAIIAGAVPWAILENRRARRQAAFLRHLPDTLQLMAGSLRAGYGVLQALDSVAKESAGPAADEFQRVITEARLGMAVEDALEAMAERIGSEDFRWVVLAINIQREVGGNLAELLDTVAETLREREMLRRQISVLSAEGRLSAIILIALPIVLTIYLILVRPDYISTLVTSGPFGWLLVGGASGLMLVGVLWIRKMIQIEV